MTGGGVLAAARAEHGRAGERAARVASQGALLLAPDGDRYLPPLPDKAEAPCNANELGRCSTAPRSSPGAKVKWGESATGGDGRIQTVCIPCPRLASNWHNAAARLLIDELIVVAGACRVLCRSQASRRNASPDGGQGRCCSKSSFHADLRVPGRRAPLLLLVDSASKSRAHERAGRRCCGRHPGSGGPGRGHGVRGCTAPGTRRLRYVRVDGMHGPGCSRPGFVLEGSGCALSNQA